MSFYPTNYSKLLAQATKGIRSLITNSWRKRSLALLSLLSGFYLASFLLSYLVSRTGYKAFIVIALTLFIELLVRTRNYMDFSRPAIENFWLGLDNMRIGITYAVVLEAFKLGS